MSPRDEDIAMISGPLGLKLIKGFHDEALRGEWQGYRSSRLGEQYRVIYRFISGQSLFQVVHITPHDDRRCKIKPVSGEKAHQRVRGGVDSHHSRVTGVQPESLAGLTGIPQATLSAIENDHVRFDVERAKILAPSLEVPSGGLGFSGMGS